VKNILCISDIHIADFRNYNFEPDFRLKQFYRLADRLIQIKNQENCIDSLIIAGDFFETSIPLPTESHVFQDFINKLKSNFNKIYFILGQHDMYYRNSSGEFDESGTAVTLECDDQFIYCDCSLVNIEGRNFYFRDYEPVSIIKDIPTCDIFIGHVTLSDNNLFGQKFEDESKFKLAVCGDIHKPIDINNCHSIGCPLQKNLNDYPYGTVGIIDLDSLKFKRVQVINNEYKFLRIYEEGNEVDSDEYTVVIKKSVKSNETQIDYNGKLVDITKGVYNLIESNIPEELLNIHSIFRDKVKFDSDIDLNFVINELNIVNFRSIKNLTLKFNDGVTFIQGNNGSGKSTILNAIKIALLGDNRLRKHIKLGEDFCELSIDLTWKGINYKIVRGSGYVQFYIDGKESNVNNKRDTESYIYETLNFLKYLDLFFLKSSEGNFAYNFINSNLLQSVFKFDSIEQYYNLATDEIKSVKRNLRECEDSKIKLEGKLEQLETNLTVCRSNLGSEVKCNISEVQNNIKYNKSLISEYEDLSRSKRLIEDLLGKVLEKPESDLEEAKSLKNKWDKLKSIEYKLKSLKDKRSSDIECPNCHHIFNIDKELDNNIKEVQLEYDNLCKDLSGQKTKSYCDEVINDHLKYNNWLKTQSDSKEKLDDINLKIQKFDNFDKNKLELDISNSEKLIQDYKVYKSKLDNIISLDSEKINLLSSIDEIKNKYKELTNFLERLENYRFIFDVSNESSLYSKIIQLIIRIISDEVIKCELDNKDIYFSYYNGKDWINYDSCSDGQKILVDLHLIKKMTTLLSTNISLLVLDEVGAQLDKNNFIKYNEMLMQLEISNILVTSHSNLLTDYNNKIELKLVDGETKINL